MIQLHGAIEAKTKHHGALTFQDVNASFQHRKTPERNEPINMQVLEGC